jgi:polyribonucleotide nucleotidyltransferase
VLSDILGDEDHLGDMDFKVTGTEKGVTALQMDIKIEGITIEIMSKALSQAKQGRMHILGCMAEALPVHREALSQFAPKIVSMQINPKKIKDIIGPGGKHIKAIIEETKVKIDVEDTGLVKIFSPDQNAIDRAMVLVQEYTGEVELDKVYNGIVTKVTNFGAFVEVRPNTEGLLHISQISDKHIRDISKVLYEGDKVNVKVLEIDDSSGKFKLSMKGLDQEDVIKESINSNS